MKFALVFFIAALSVNAWAKTTALEALQQVLPENGYEGVTPQNDLCEVDVIRDAGQTRVELFTTDITPFLVVENAPYEWDAATEFFTTSITVSTGPNTIELTFSTKRVDAGHRVVTFQRVFRNAEGQQWVSAQVCTIEN